MTFFRIPERRSAWASAVYYQNDLTVPPTGEAVFLLESKRVFRGPHHIHTQADPFLFHKDGDLYLFVETQILDDPGRIGAYVSRGNRAFEAIGTVLAEPFHLSYPNVFAVGDRTFMIPESQESGAVRLYEFLDFPKGASFYREMLSGRYADPSPLYADGVWYLFATSARGLELFWTDDLIDGTLELHPASPITDDPADRRCGGTPFRINDRLVRPAQDCSERYGGNLNLMEIQLITRQEYRERPFERSILKTDANWNDKGGHHISVCERPNGVAVAIDGQSEDYAVHQIFGRAWMKLTGYHRLKK